MKTCNTCGETKIISEFSFVYSKPKDICKECVNAKMRERYHKDKQEHAVRQLSVERWAL